MTPEHFLFFIAGVVVGGWVVFMFGLLILRVAQAVAARRLNALADKLKKFNDAMVYDSPEWYLCAKCKALIDDGKGGEAMYCNCSLTKHHSALPQKWQKVRVIALKDGE